LFNYPYIFSSEEIGGIHELWHSYSMKSSILHTILI